MEWLLKILGVLCLMFMGLVGLSIVGWILLRRKLSRALANLAGRLEEAGATELPHRLHLRRHQQVEWLNPEPVEALTGAIRSLGFLEVGTFVPEELTQIRLKALVHVEDRAYATVYEHAQAGVWVDFVSEYEDGRTVTYTAAPQGEEIEHPPTSTKVFAREADPTELYQRFVTERAEGGLKPVSAAGFVSAFQDGYARDMDWRNSRGGNSEEEIRRSLTASGSEYSEAEVREIREQSLQRAVEGLDLALEERFQQQTRMSVAEWEARRERLVFVFDLLPPRMLKERAENWLGAEEDDETEDLPGTQGLPARAAFAAYNQTLPVEHRFEKLGELTDPVPADVYAAPEVEEEEEE